MDDLADSIRGRIEASLPGAAAARLFAEIRPGDVGTLSFAIRRQDLADGAFDRTWMVLQCG